MISYEIGCTFYLVLLVLFFGWFWFIINLLVADFHLYSSCKLMIQTIEPEQRKQRAELIQTRLEEI